MPTRPPMFTPTKSPPATSIIVLLIAILAISSSAVLIKAADAPAVAVSFWRTLGGAIILAPAAWRSATKPTGRQWQAIAMSGLALGVHFATWLSSLELTSVAASVSLVSTAPIFVAVAMALLGQKQQRLTWIAIAIAVAGAAVIAGGDLGYAGSEDAPSPLLGDALAVIGAATVAVYLTIGDHLRATLSTAGYAARTYGLAALCLLIFAAVGGVQLTGYTRGTWLAIVGMILGPQLAGHTAINYLLKQLGSVSVSLATLLEPLGAATLVWLIFGDVPPLAAVIGGAMVVGAVGLRLLGSEQRVGPGDNTMNRTMGQTETR